MWILFSKVIGIVQIKTDNRGNIRGEYVNINQSALEVMKSQIIHR